MAPGITEANNRDKNFTDRKLQARIEQLEDSIKRYLIELDRADRDATAVLPGRVAHLKDKIAKVKQQMQAGIHASAPPASHASTCAPIRCKKQQASLHGHGKDNGIAN
jgi:hypothetical protein